jgi:hypothetical protein
MKKEKSEYKLEPIQRFWLWFGIGVILACLVM